MHSTDATLLLRATHDDAALHALLTALGFPTSPLPLDATARDRLGLPPESVLDAHIARGDGVLRALVIDVAPRASLRDTLTVIARRLAARVPQLLWLVIVRDAAALAIATWQGGATPHMATLITSRDHVTPSDAETLCALVASSTVTPDGVRHLRWFETLGRESITRRFFGALRGAVTTMTNALAPAIPEAAAREIALLTACRLLFLSFIETKGWLAGDYAFLTNSFAGCMARGGAYHRTVLEPLFFGTLNTPPRARAPRARTFGAVPFLNGGLFTRTPLERRHRHTRFSDDALGTLFGDVLVRYRFTAREATATAWTESAIDPEILGRTFESLMAADERKRHGVFYTPPAYVERLVTLTLVPALASAAGDTALVERALDGEMIDCRARDRLTALLAKLRVLDPACGSGAFLVHLLDRLATLRITLGDTRPGAAVRRSVLETSIHGVDISPTAVWLCQLRLWLATVIDADVTDPMRVRPLPNLDRQIRVGDSLAGDAFAPDDDRTPGPASFCTRMATLRSRYVSATGRRKTTLARTLDQAERSRAIALLERDIAAVHAHRREIIAHARSSDLFRTRHGLDAARHARLRELRATGRALRARGNALRRGAALPFSYAAHFAHVAHAGGFDAIIGNPPWVRIHNIAAADRNAYRRRYRVLHTATWSSGAEACAGRGFGSQGDLAAPFVERSVDLLRASGAVGLLLPSKLWRSLAGGGVRRLVHERTTPLALEDHSEARPEFDAAVYPSIFVATRAHAVVDSAPPGAAVATLAAASHRAGAVHHWRMPPSRLALDSTDGAPWLLVPPAVRHAFDRLHTAGTPLARTHFGRPWLGVKSGCNAPFVVRVHDARDPAHVSSGDEHGQVERALLRPVLRGETVTPWRTTPSDECIVWTHAQNGAPLSHLPPATGAWLRRWRRQLERRSDARHSACWWTLFRTEAADPRRARVVWNDIGRTPRAAVLLPGDPTVPLNTCYVARAPSVRDGLALAALLNAPVIAAWLSILAEPARGGYHRYLGWTLATLPLPRDWTRARDALAPLACGATSGSLPSPDALDDAVLAAFDIPPHELSALVHWASGA